MKTYETSEGNEFTIDYSSAEQSKYGHKTITSTVILLTGERQDFSATTNNMPDYDDATDLEGQEKYEALFDLIYNAVSESIDEWVEEINYIDLED